MSEYAFRRLAFDNFEVAKFDGGDVPAEVYQIHLGKAPFCRCPAFSSGKTRPCKHMKGLHAWIAAGEQPGFVSLSSEKAKGKKASRSPNKEREAIRQLEDHGPAFDEPEQADLGDDDVD